MKKNIWVKFLYCNLLFSLVYLEHVPFWLEGSIFEVLDGDTVIFQTKSGLKIKLRLAYIDAPESSQKSLDGQDIGVDSTKALMHLSLDKVLRVQLIEKGYYGRWIGVLWDNETSINKEMVGRGHAAIYPRSNFKTVRELNEYLEVYSRARFLHVGIWRSEGMLAPRAYRKKMSKKKIVQAK